MKRRLGAESVQSHEHAESLHINRGMAFGGLEVPKAAMYPYMTGTQGGAIGN